MNVRGIYKTSVIEFPGRICTVLFCGGCSMTCRYCYNRDLALNSAELPVYSEEEILSFLKSRKGRIDGVSISGGEPTLSHDLIPFMKKLRELDLGIKLDTNGLNPKAVKDALGENLLDYTAVDIKTSPEKYRELTGTDRFDVIMETVSLLKASGISMELRTTCVPGFAEEEDLQAIGERTGRVPAYSLQQFTVKGELMDPAFAGLKPYSKDHLFKLKGAVENFADICRIKGI